MIQNLYDEHHVCDFVLGANPQQNKGTLIPVPIVKEEDPREWCCTVDNPEQKKITFYVTPAADAVVGKYQVKVEFLYLENGRWKLQTKRTLLRQTVIILFNPWCPRMWYL